MLVSDLLAAIFVCVINALPKQRFSRDDATDHNLVGLSTNILAASLLKGSVDSDANHVFSPVGFSSILAILSEGAKGQTLQEFYDVLRFPSDSTAGTCV